MVWDTGKPYVGLPHDAAASPALCRGAELLGRCGGLPKSHGWPQPARGVVAAAWQGKKPR